LLLVGVQKWLGTLHGISAKVLQLPYHVHEIVKHDAVHPEGAGSDNILDLVVDKDGSSGIDAGLLENMLVEAQVRFALMCGGSE
jgi:hypothetical protein